MNKLHSAAAGHSTTLSQFGRYAIVVVAFLGWFFAGVHLAITSIVMRVAAADLLPEHATEGEIGKWFGWLVCAFLFGAASGGYLFGLVGDRIGRARAMAASICCYSIFSGLAYFVMDPWGLLVLRFLACMGIGGMWPSGIALLSEAWSGVARPVKTTLLGILLGTIPLFGGWGVSNWATAWASEAGDTPAATASDTFPTQSDPTLKSRAAIARSLPGSISSLLGGALAFYFGRKRTYFGLCVCALICTQMLFRVNSPQDDGFLFWMGLLGFFSGFFFGWLPLCLPELFPTRIRSTGAGVSFNWGRILTGVGVLASAIALKEAFQGQYARVGQVTGLIYAVGMVAILLTPPMSDSALED